MIFKIVKKKLFVLSLVVICLFLYIVYLGISLDGVYVKRGTFGYYLTIHSSLIKKFPLHGKINDEKFTNRGGDGYASTYSVIYQSNADKNSLVKIFEEYLLNNGYKKVEKVSSNDEMFYETNSSSYVRILFVSKNDGIYAIEIEQSY